VAVPTERTALITGSCSGFGLLTAVTLAQRSWRVLATMRDLTHRDRLEDAARTAGVLDRIEIHALDVTNPDQIEVLATLVAARENKLDAIVNNAGLAVAGFADDVSDAELRLQFDTNFFGAVAVTRAFLPQLRRQHSGCVIMLSSISGRIGFPGVSSYCASKFALEGWSETLRMELKPLGIQVVLVEPGAYETDIWSRNTVIAAGMLSPESPNAVRIPKWRSHTKPRKPRGNPQVVADGIADILDRPKPKLRYVFGRDAQIAVRARRLIPWRMLERILIKASGLDD
jgi:NAD(P)-dependent dehydrogenase (short-subunit alcohol dehydrogenase family)